jgi:Domain of unknown function (DUF397)
MPIIESQPEWVKSSLSFANGNCVEVASLSGGEVGVRNSRDIAGGILRFTPDEWHAFIGGVRNGEFDRFGALPASTGRRVPRPAFPLVSPSFRAAHERATCVSGS